jgi:phage/plasmid-like protein (TIGR03299 family)
MAHNIYRDSTGKDCMFVVGDRQDAWHLLGQRCNSAATWEQAVELAGLDWTVSKQRNYARNLSGKVVETDSYTIFRSSDNAQLGTVGAGFEIKQNRECFQFVDTLLEANGGAHYDSAGALGNGATIWCSVRVPRADFAIGADKHEMYLIFSTAHDGSMAHTVFLADVRPVCQNTLRAALASADGMFRVKHTKSANVRLENAKKLMTGVITDADILRQKLQTLANRRMTRESMVAVLNRLFPAPKEENASTTRRENVITEVLGLYSANDNGAFPEIAGSAYNMLNAVTEYADHYRSPRITTARNGMSVEQARAENAVTGTGDKLKSSALAIIDEVTSEISQPNGADIYRSPMDDSQFLKALGISL